MSTNIIEQFYILSARGDSIIFRDFRTDSTKLISTVELFYTYITNKSIEPIGHVFTSNYINYIWLRKNTMYFVLTTRYNINPTLCVELLIQLTHTIKDFCGTLTEDTIRLNFVLVYELLDEIIDYGYIQTTTTDYLKSYVFNTPIVYSDKSMTTNALSNTVDTISSVTNNVVNNLVNNSNLKSIVSSGTSSTATHTNHSNHKTTPSTSVDKPVVNSITTNNASVTEQRKNEIYVDIYEKVTAIFNSNAVCTHSTIDGRIQIKSYLYGKPALKLALNENLVIRSQHIGDEQLHNYNTNHVVLDDCLYHHSIDLHEFDTNKMLHFNAVDGEYTLMNYRINGNHSTNDTNNHNNNYQLPFRMYPHLELMDTYRFELLLQLRNEISTQYYAGNVSIHVNIPDSATAVSAELRNDKTQSYEYNQSTHKFVWKIKKIKGESDEQCRIKITLNTITNTINLIQLRKQINSIVINFEIPMYTPSGLTVRYLRINDSNSNHNNNTTHNKETQPYRWVRYVCRSQSYVVRL